VYPPLDLPPENNEISSLPNPPNQSAFYIAATEIYETESSPVAESTYAPPASNQFAPKFAVFTPL